MGTLDFQHNNRMQELQKDIKNWYARLEQRGKIILGVAIVGLVWLIFQLIWAIAGGGSILPAWLSIPLNIVAVALVSLVIAQFVMMRRMQRNFQENLREAMTRGKRGGNRAEQISGVRNRGSMRARGGGVNMQQAMSMMTQVSTEDLDKQYRPKIRPKATVIEKWAEIEEPGLYALIESPKAIVEIIEATEIGGGFFVGKYSEDGIVKERNLMTHRSTGEPLRFDTLRNAKKALSGGNRPPGKKRRKKR